MEKLQQESNKVKRELGPLTDKIKELKQQTRIKQMYVED